MQTKPDPRRFIAVHTPRIYGWDFSRKGLIGKFLPCFRRAFKAFPPSDKKRILKCWKRLPKPIVEIWYPNRAEYLGSCFLFGQSLKFNPDVVELLPAQHLCTLIAHELTHVLFLTIGNIGNNPSSDNGNLLQEMQIADYLGWELGFSEDDLDTWIESTDPGAVELRARMDARELAEGRRC